MRNNTSEEKSNSEMNRFLLVGEEFIELVDNSLTNKVRTENENAVLHAIYNKNLNVFHAIHHLAQKTNTGTVILASSRILLEGFINVEYMKTKNFNKMLEQFRLFEIAEAKQDHDYLLSKGIDISKLNPEEIDEEFQDNKVLFEIRPGEIWQSWSHKKFDEMLDSVIEKNNYSIEEKETILSTYLQGNRAVHLSPSAVKLTILGRNVYEIQNANNTRLGYIASLSSIIRLSMTFCTKIEREDLTNSFQILFNKL